MEESFLIDSNVLIDYMGMRFPQEIKPRLDKVFDESFHYSIISRMEVLNIAKTTITEFEQLEAFIDAGESYDVDLQICNAVIGFSKSISKKNLPDLIIAATAIVTGRTLLTRNIADFKNIHGLKFENPWDWS